MKTQQSNARQCRTRTLIQAGGILQKAGLLEQFGIQGGDDLQDYDHIHKAYALLGYLIDCDEKVQGFKADQDLQTNMDYWILKGRQKFG